MRLRICLAGLLLAAYFSLGSGHQRPSPGRAGTARTVTVITEPNSVVWLDEIRRGTTDASGRLSQIKVLSGAHNLRVRATGFKEIAMPLTAGQRGEIRVRLVRTTDAAELTFQQAEIARETAKDEAARQQAAEFYRRTLRLRPAFPAAHVGLARVLLDLNDTSGALGEIESARRDRPV